MVKHEDFISMVDLTIETPQGDVWVELGMDADNGKRQVFAEQSFSPCKEIILYMEWQNDSLTESQKEIILQKLN